MPGRAAERMPKVVVVDSDAGRRTRFVQQLRGLGHELVELAELPSEELPTADVAVLGGDQRDTACSAYRSERRASWILVVTPREGVASALAAGADDCMLDSCSLDELELRLQVASKPARSDNPPPSDTDLPSDTEAALRQSEASLRSVLHATPDGIIVHREGRYLFLNPAALAQLGLAPDTDLIGREIFDQVEEDYVPAVRERIESMIRTGQPAPVRDIHFRRANGELLVGEVASIPAIFDGKQAIISIIREVGEQRRIQSQLFLADRLATVGTLAVGVAHEINNPLSWVMGNLGLLADEFDNQVRMREQPGHNPTAVAASRARVRELLGRAQEGTERVRRIVQDLGRLGRPDDGEPQAIDVHALLDSSIEIADVQIRHRARLTREYRASGFVRGSEARLGQVFLNLLVNAGQAIEPGAPRSNQVRVTTCDLDDGRIEIAISDTGAGMTEAVCQRIFEPFYTTKPVGEGSGIGLAISHSIVTALGGEIVVDSELGSGTRFRVLLQRAEADVPSRPGKVVREDSDADRSGGTPVARILVVDDEPLIREMVCDALSSHQVTAVATGREAIELIAAQDWELILCDMVLPEISGLEVYREIERLRPELLPKLVFMTGGDVSGRSPRLPDGGRVRRLEKPFSIKSLRALAHSAALGDTE